MPSFPYSSDAGPRPGAFRAPGSDTGFELSSPYTRGSTPRPGSFRMSDDDDSLYAPRRRTAPPELQHLFPGGGYGGYGGDAMRPNRFQFENANTAATNADFAANAPQRPLSAYNTTPGSMSVTLPAGMLPANIGEGEPGDNVTTNSRGQMTVSRAATMPLQTAQDQQQADAARRGAYVNNQRRLADYLNPGFREGAAQDARTNLTQEEGNQLRDLTPAYIEHLTTQPEWDKGTQQQTLTMLKLLHEHTMGLQRDLDEARKNTQGDTRNDINQNRANTYANSVDQRGQNANRAAGQRDRGLDQRDRGLDQSDQRLKQPKTRSGMGALWDLMRGRTPNPTDAITGGSTATTQPAPSATPDFRNRGLLPGGGRLERPPVPALPNPNGGTPAQARQSYPGSFTAIDKSGKRVAWDGRAWQPIGR